MNGLKGTQKMRLFNKTCTIDDIKKDTSIALPKSYLVSGQYQKQISALNRREIEEREQKAQLKCQVE